MGEYNPDDCHWPRGKRSTEIGTPNPASVEAVPEIGEAMVTQDAIRQALKLLWLLYKTRYQFIAATWQNGVLDALGEGAALERSRQELDGVQTDFLRVVMAGVERAIDHPQREV